MKLKIGSCTLVYLFEYSLVKFPNDLFETSHIQNTETEMTSRCLRILRGSGTLTMSTPLLFVDFKSVTT